MQLIPCLCSDMDAGQHHLKRFDTYSPYVEYQDIGIMPVAPIHHEISPKRFRRIQSDLCLSLPCQTNGSSLQSWLQSASFQHGAAALLAQGLGHEPGEHLSHSKLSEIAPGQRQGQQEQTWALGRASRRIGRDSPIE